MSSFRFRFRFTSNGSVTNDGWYIDDVCVQESSTPSLPFPFSDDMEGGALTEANWLPAAWTLTSSDSHSLTHSWSAVGQSGYPQNALTTSGNINLSSSTCPRLAFWYRSNAGGNAVVQVSQDGGRTWVNLPSLGNQTTWTRKEIDLTPYRGPLFRLRFLMGSYSPSNYWYVDDVLITDASASLSLSISNPTLHGADLSWTPSAISDFAGYEVYMRSSAGVTWEDQLVFSTTDRNHPFCHVDYTLLDNAQYYFRVYAVQTNGMHSCHSNEVNTGYTIPLFPYGTCDNMESGTGQWDWGQPWGLTTEQAHSGSQCWTD